MLKRGMKLAWAGLFGVMLIAGCASDKSGPKSQSQNSWAYDPADPDKYEPSLPLDIYFPPKPLSKDYQQH